MPAYALWSQSSYGLVIRNIRQGGQCIVGDVYRRVRMHNSHVTCKSIIFQYRLAAVTRASADAPIWLQVVFTVRNWHFRLCLASLGS